LILDWRLEREFGTRKYADSHRTILRRDESSCAGAEVVCNEFFPNFGWAYSHAVQTIVAHIKELLSWKPPIVQYYQKRRRGPSIREQCRWPSGRNQVITSSLRCDSATSLCSVHDRLGLHCKSTFSILRPQACPAVRFWHAAYRERGIVEQRTYGAEA